jgi:type II secretory pathway component GspD/PulD (secretin)
VLQKTNLLIFITPSVMTDQEQLQAITRQKKEQMAPLLEEDR